MGQTVPGKGHGIFWDHGEKEHVPRSKCSTKMMQFTGPFCELLWIDTHTQRNLLWSKDEGQWTNVLSCWVVHRAYKCNEQSAGANRRPPLSPQDLYCIPQETSRLTSTQAFIFSMGFEGWTSLKLHHVNAFSYVSLMHLLLVAVLCVVLKFYAGIRNQQKSCSNWRMISNPNCSEIFVHFLFFLTSFLLVCLQCKKLFWCQV